MKLMTIFDQEVKEEEVTEENFFQLLMERGSTKGRLQRKLMEEIFRTLRKEAREALHEKLAEASAEGDATKTVFYRRNLARLLACGEAPTGMMQTMTGVLDAIPTCPVLALEPREYRLLHKYRLGLRLGQDLTTFIDEWDCPSGTHRGADQTQTRLVDPSAGLLSCAWVVYL